MTAFNSIKNSGDSEIPLGGKAVATNTQGVFSSTYPTQLSANTESQEERM